MPGAEQTITTARLVIRPWQRADLDAYQGWLPFTEPLLAGFNPGSRSSLELDLEWVAAALNPSLHYWSIVAEGTIIGRITLRPVKADATAGELGMLLGAPYVDRGFGHEALHGWLEAYFGRWHRERLVLQVACWNRRARHLYERAGFVEVRRYWQSAGPPADYAFLDEPQYAALADYFRRSPIELYEACAEMWLTRDQWALNGAR